MKNRIIAFGMLNIGIFFACLSCSTGMFVIRGNGKLITSERSVSSFDRISIHSSAEVRYYLSDEYRAIVTVDSNLDDYAEIYTRGNALNIGNKRGYPHPMFTKYTVEVYGPALTGVSVSGAGSFTGNDTITASVFDTNVSGSGMIEGSIECNRFSADISGSGEIKVSGNGNKSDIDISGSGIFRGTNFPVSNATVHISGSGKANVYVTDNLDANISGAGIINYQGAPKIKSSVSGSGRINKL